MTDTKISEELLALVRDASRTGDTREIPIIVTVSGRAGPSLLEAAGMVVSRVFENIPAVAGRCAPQAIAALARIEQVERIELDGEVRAI